MTDILVVSCIEPVGGVKSHRIGWLPSESEALGGYVGCLDCRKRDDRIPETDQRRQVVALWESKII